MKYKLKAKIDVSVEPNEIRVKPISGNIWEDLGYWLEVAGFMSYQAMEYRRWGKEEMADYVKEYIIKCLDGYEDNKSKKM